MYVHIYIYTCIYIYSYEYTCINKAMILPIPGELAVMQS